MFTDKQKLDLAAPLSRDHVKSRTQGGRGVSYVESWHVISEANRVFGFDGWSSETVDLKCGGDRERTIGKDKKPGWGVSYVARVRVTVFAGDRVIVREGVGAGHGIDVDLGQAHESAVKEAESDARKRALMTFGNQFGLALYDKEQVNVCEPQDESALRYVEFCKAKVAEFDKPGAAAAWWKSDQRKKDFDTWKLTTPQMEEIKQLVIDREAELKPELLRAG